MGIFAGIEEVNAPRDNRYVPEGTHLVQITGVKQGRTKETDVPYFVVEMVVIQSDHPEFAPGDTMAWMQMVHKYKHYFLEAVKGFIATATGYSPEDVIEDVVEYVTGENQPLVGQGLRIRARLETNAKSGKGYTKTAFTKVDLDASAKQPLPHKTETDHFGPAAGAEGGPGVVAIQKSDIPEFGDAAPSRVDKMSDAEVNNAFHRAIHNGIRGR